MAGKLAARTPFAYRSGATILHRAPAAVKLVCVILLTAVACGSVPGLAIAILALIAASLFVRIPPWELLKGSKLLLLMSFCILLVKTFLPGIVFNADGFFEGIITVMRIFVSFAAAALLFAVTTMRELRLSLAAVENFFVNLTQRRKGTKTRRKEKGKKVRGGFVISAPPLPTPHSPLPFFSLGISLMLGFIPRFFDLWEAASLACEARSCRRGLRRILILVPLVTERMMEAAAETALALEARALGSE